nr:MAG: hypothetical protein [Chemarfal virus 20]
MSYNSTSCSLCEPGILIGVTITHRSETLLSSSLGCFGLIGHFILFLVLFNHFVMFELF